MPHVDLLGSPVCIDTDAPKTDKHANLVSASGRRPSSSFTPNAGLPAASPLHDPIQSIRHYQPPFDRRRQGETWEIFT